MGQADTLKKLKVRVGVVKRTRKELEAYKKEEETMRQKIQKMRDEGSCQHDIKQQENVLGETRMMLPDTERRLRTGHAELFAFIGDNLRDEWSEMLLKEEKGSGEQGGEGAGSSSDSAAASGEAEKGKAAEGVSFAEELKEARLQDNACRILLADLPVGLPEVVEEEEI